MPFHVVIVDDDPTILRLLSATLGNALGAAVTTFTDPREALAAWPTLAPVGVVLSDLTMPGMSGFEFARDLRALAPAVPFIVLSAIDARVELSPFVDALLVKPCSLHTLQLTIETVVAQRAPPGTAPPQPDKLAALRARYCQHLATERPRFARLLAEAGTPSGQQALRAALHQLAGTSGTYELSEVMQSALEVRDALLRGDGLAAAGRALLHRLERAGGEAR